MQKDDLPDSSSSQCTELFWQEVPAPPAANASVEPAIPRGYESVVRTEWKYDNQGSGQIAIIATLCGKVCYIHGDTVTDYHGNFREDAYNGWVVIKFDCRGDEWNLKSMVLLRQPDGSYSGPDYKLRNVVITKVSTSRSYQMEQYVYWRLEWQNKRLSWYTPNIINSTDEQFYRWCTRQTLPDDLEYADPGQPMPYDLEYVDPGQPK